MVEKTETTSVDFNNGLLRKSNNDKKIFVNRILTINREINNEIEIQVFFKIVGSISARPFHKYHVNPA